MKTSKPRIEPRKPGSVRAAMGFIAGGDLASTMERPTSGVSATEPTPSTQQTSEAPTVVPAVGRKATMSRRRSGRSVRQLTVYLPPDVEKQLRVVAVEEDRLPSDVIADALQAYFAHR